MCELSASCTVGTMSEAITQRVEGAMASPWVLLALFAVAAIDGFFPLVPSESLVVTAGVFAACTGEPSLPLVILAAALGAFTGDHVSYLLGAGGGASAPGRRDGRGVRVGEPDARRARRDDPRRLPLHPRRAHRGDAHLRRRPLPAAHVLDLRRHRGAQLGRCTPGSSASWAAPPSRRSRSRASCSASASRSAPRSRSSSSATCAAAQRTRHRKARCWASVRNGRPT